MQNLLKSMERGSKLLTGSAKQRLDKMLTKVIVHQDLPLQVCESDTMHDFFLESSQQFCVQQRMTDVEGNHFKMGVDDWDIIGQCTASLMTVAVL